MEITRVLKLLLVIAAAGCAAANISQAEERMVGPQTETVDAIHYERILHVCASKRSSVEKGTREAPYRSVDEAIRQAVGAAQNRRIAVFVAEGNYSVRSLRLGQFVDLYGGFEATHWTREVSRHKTILNGEGSSTVVIGAENARIDGFVITGGKSDRFGGGIFCSECSPIISNNTIVLNRSTHEQSRIEAAKLHQQSIGGGGICCLGASPLIRNNLIARNTTEFGNGGGVSCISNSSPRIEGNLFSANESGVHDPQTRSSNGGAIACSHYSSPVIFGNVLLNNHAGGRGDGGGIYGEYSSSPHIEENIFLGNWADDDGAAAYFMAASRPLFRNNTFVGNGPGQGVIRLSKNGLGTFDSNIVVGNSTDGILCRAASAVTVNNLICENAGHGIFSRDTVLSSRNDTICGQTLFGIEVDRGSARIVNGLIVANAAGQVRLGTNELWVRHCLLAGKTDAEPAGRAALETTAQSGLDRILVYAEMPQFRDDSLTAKVRIIRYDPQRLTTAAELTAALPTDPPLTRRPVRIGTQWTVCRVIQGRKISVWGDLGSELSPTEATSCYFPPTYHLAPGSAGIDGGDLLGSPPADFEGQPRPIDAQTSDQVDIGADEYRKPVPLAADSNPARKSIRLALVQFDAKPGEVEKNLATMERLARKAVDNGARLVMFHELATTDYMDDMTRFAEPIPNGPSCQRMKSLAKQLGCYLSFGMPEKKDDRLYIAQVFFGPQGFIYSYRKTWLCKTKDDSGYRNEWARYNPGTGPELFQIDGIRATCFICADATAPRCIEQAREIEPDLVFFPVNRGARKFQEYPDLVAQVGALTLVTNRVGKSYARDCAGGTAVYDTNGQIAAQANREHREEILYYNFTLRTKDPRRVSGPVSKGD